MTRGIIPVRENSKQIHIQRDYLSVLCLTAYLLILWVFDPRTVTPNCELSFLEEYPENRQELPQTLFFPQHPKPESLQKPSSVLRTRLPQLPVDLSTSPTFFVIFEKGHLPFHSKHAKKTTQKRKNKLAPLHEIPFRLGRQGSSF